MTDQLGVVWQSAYANGLRHRRWTMTGPDFMEQIPYEEGRMRGSHRLQGNPAMTGTELVALLYSESYDPLVLRTKLRARGCEFH